MNVFSVAANMNCSGDNGIVPCPRTQGLTSDAGGYAGLTTMPMTRWGVGWFGTLQRKLQHRNRRASGWCSWDPECCLFSGANGPITAA